MISNDIINSNLTDVYNIKGLLVGINYDFDLKQPNNKDNLSEIIELNKFIKDNFPDAKLNLITNQTNELPTKKNILANLQSMINDSKPGDLLIFAYSGYGEPYVEGTTNLNLKNNLYPIDFMELNSTKDENQQELILDQKITEEEINEITKNIPTDVKLLILLDAYRFWINDNFKKDLTSEPIENETISEDIVESSWVYANLSSKKEIWLTPLELKFYQEFGCNKYIIPITEENHNELSLSTLFSNPNKSYIAKTNFIQLSGGNYMISSPELRIAPISVNLPKNPNSFKSLINYVNIYNSQIVTCQHDGFNIPNKANNHSKLETIYSWFNWFKKSNNSRDYNNKAVPDIKHLLLHPFRPYGRHHHHHLQNFMGKLFKKDVISTYKSTTGEAIMLVNNSSNNNFNNGLIKGFLSAINAYGGLKNLFNALFAKDDENLKVVEKNFGELLNANDDNNIESSFFQNGELNDNFSFSPYNISSSSIVNSNNFSLPIPIRNNYNASRSYSQPQNNLNNSGLYYYEKNLVSRSFHNFISPNNEDNRSNVSNGGSLDSWGSKFSYKI